MMRTLRSLEKGFERYCLELGGKPDVDRILDKRRELVLLLACRKSDGLPDPRKLVGFMRGVSELLEKRKKGIVNFEFSTKKSPAGDSASMSAKVEKREHDVLHYSVSFERRIFQGSEPWIKAKVDEMNSLISKIRPLEGKCKLLESLFTPNNFYVICDVRDDKLDFMEEILGRIKEFHEQALEVYKSESIGRRSILLNY